MNPQQNDPNDPTYVPPTSPEQEIDSTPFPNDQTPPSEPEIAPDTLQTLDELEAEAGMTSTPQSPIAKTEPVIVDSLKTEVTSTPQPQINTPQPSASNPSQNTPIGNDTPTPLIVDSPELPPAVAVTNKPVTQMGQVDGLASAPKKSSKASIIVLVALIAVLLAGAGYFIWQSLQTVANPETTQSGGDAPDLESTESNTQDQSVNDEASSIENSVNSLEDTEYADSTLDDNALSQ